MQDPDSSRAGGHGERPLRRRHQALILAGVAAGSAAGLAFEIALTRVFAVTQFYHFAFLAVSLALLGLGASGSALSAFPGLGRGGPGRWAWFAAAQGVTTMGAYAATNALPFDSFAIAWDRTQVLYLVVYYLVLAVPFFLGGLVVASLLSQTGRREAVPSHRVYAASLVGSGIGAVLALGGLAWLGGESTIALAAALAMGGAAAFSAVADAGRVPQAIVAALAVGLLAVAVTVPEPLAMKLSPYKDLSAALRYPGAEVAQTQWDAGTRIDLVVSDGIRSLPGLGLTYRGVPPAQDGVTFDGDDLSPVPRVAPAEAGFAPHMLTSIAYRLRPGAAALILEPRGGLDALVALAGGARSVVAVEPHGRAVTAARATGPTVFDDPRVTIAAAEARAFVERTDDRYDVIQLALTAPYRPVTSGAYSLAEDYRLTVEAFERYLDRLQPGGIFTAARWVQTPPSEEIRLLAVAAEAVRSSGRDPSQAVVMLRSYSTAVILVQPVGFGAGDVAEIAAFAEAERFDVVAGPGFDPAAANRFNVVPDEQYSRLAAALLTGPDPEQVAAAYDFDIRPPTDDHPFFGHFFTWSQASAVLDTLGRTWQPFGGAGYFVLVALLVISALGAAVLITAPLLLRRGHRAPVPAALRWWTVGYFGLLGLAFLFVEIPLIQQHILLIGRPTTAFATVVFAILVFSGVGSAWSRRVPWRPGALALTALAAAYPFGVRLVTPLVLPAPLVARILVAALLIAPLGFLMGIMFPSGLAHLEERAPELVPWAWAINGTVSVISAAAAAILALGFGFSLVVRAGALAYGGAALLARGGASRSGSVL